MDEAQKKVAAFMFVHVLTCFVVKTEALRRTFPPSKGFYRLPYYYLVTQGAYW
jgi:hypothetical protein